MSIKDLFDSITPGGIVSVLVIISLVVQISPLKVNPWGWIGDQLNANIRKDMNQRIDEIEDEITNINGKLNSHMAESYRTVILEFADTVMANKKYTHDKWRQMLKVCAAYESMIINEGLLNGDATEAINYIHRKYQECCNTGNFDDFKKV